MYIEIVIILNTWADEIECITLFIAIQLVSFTFFNLFSIEFEFLLIFKKYLN